MKPGDVVVGVLTRAESRFRMCVLTVHRDELILKGHLIDREAVDWRGPSRPADGEVRLVGAIVLVINSINES